MKVRSWHWFFFGWIILLYVFSLSCFLRGFLLIRREVHMKSSRADPFILDHRYKKVIILMIDALRYDFISYNNATRLETTPPFLNKLSVVYDLLSSNHAELYKVWLKTFFEYLKLNFPFSSLQIPQQLQCNV